FSEVEVRPLRPSVTPPTMIFHARGDQAIPFAAGEYLAENIPGAVFVPLESNNHILLDSDEAWPAFVRSTRHFLSGEAGDRPLPRAAAARPSRETTHHCESAR